MVRDDPTSRKRPSRGENGEGGNWVLVSDGANADTRDCVVTIRALASAGYKPAVTVRRPGGLLSRYVARRILIDGGDTARSIVNEMEDGGYCAFIPAGEDVVLCMEPQVPMLLDKVSTSRRAREVGLPVPDEIVFEGPSDLRAAAATLRYPVVIKPAIRTFKAFRADDASHLDAMPEDAGGLIVQPHLSGQMSAVAGIMWESRVHSSVAERWERIWPLDCGLATWAVTVPRTEYVEDALSALMSGYTGLFVAQFIDGHLIDLNLRAHSSLPLAVRAGANLAAIYADLARGLGPASKHAVPGHTFRWVSGDVKGVTSSVRNRVMSIPQALRAMSPVSGTAHSMFSWKDPYPVLARVAARFRR